MTLHLGDAVQMAGPLLTPRISCSSAKTLGIGRAGAVTAHQGD
jgi:hypothetical protein